MNTIVHRDNWEIAESKYRLPWKGASDGLLRRIEEWQRSKTRATIDLEIIVPPSSTCQERLVSAALQFNDVTFGTATRGSFLLPAPWQQTKHERTHV